jgi:hypothetical protein
MKNSLFVLSILILIFSSIHAQTPKIFESEPLGEIADGWVDLLQFKNGNTAFLFISDEDDFKIKLYNTSHKLTVDKTIRPAFTKHTMYRFAKSAFIIDNEIVILFSAIKKVSTFKVAPACYRVIINGTTGNVIKEEEIAVLTPFGAAGEVAFRKHYYGSPDFYISKDPNSDNYAVAQFDSNESDGNKKLKITHYGLDHKIINEGYFLANGNKNVSFSDMAVVGDTKVYVCASVSNSEYGGFTSIGCFNKETSNFTQNTLDKVNIKSRLHYNKHNGTLIMFRTDLVDSKSSVKFFGPNKDTQYYAANITLINPTTLGIDFQKDIPGPTLNKNYANRYSEIGSFSGVPYGFYINDDQTYTVIYQELNVQIIYSGSHKSSVSTFFGSLGISVLNDKFQEQNSFLIPASYYLQGEEYETLSSYNENFSAPKHLKAENHYKLCSYINKKNQKIILFNDDPENIEEVKNGKIKLVGSLGGADSFKVTIDGGDINREFLFPRLQKFHSFGILIAKCYDPLTESMVTIMRSNKKGWQNTIVWMNL